MSNLKGSRPDIQHLQELYRCDFICIALQIFEDDYNNHCWIIPTVFKDLVLGHFQGVPLYCMQVVTSGHDSILWPKTSFQKFLSSFPLITFFTYFWKLEFSHHFKSFRYLFQVIVPLPLFLLPSTQPFACCTRTLCTHVL